jgi:hypothetical protein
MKRPLFTPISFFPRSRGKMKKGDRKGSSDFDGSRDRIFERENKNASLSLVFLRTPFPLMGKAGIGVLGHSRENSHPYLAFPFKGKVERLFFLSS